MTKRSLLLVCLALSAQAAHGAAIDRDLMEVTVPQLEHFYESHRYTVTQVVEWYAARIAKYDGIYLAVESPDIKAALATAAREDAEAAAGAAKFVRPALWG